MLKQWPENGDMVDIEELVDPVVKAIRFAYTISRRNKGRDIPYDGLDIGKESKAVCNGPETKLSNYMLERSMENGRNALTELVHLAVLLGYEQGRRSLIAENTALHLMKDTIIESLSAERPKY